MIVGLVLAGGTSSRLGQPKQLLPYRGATLLDATLAMARSCRFDQLVVAVGGAADEVRSTVALSGCDVVESEAPADGCSSSIAAALAVVDPRAEGLVLLLGDQPGVRPETVAALVDGAGRAAMGVVRYDDGRGHPFWLGAGTFADLADLHGDKGVWRLLESGRHDVVEVPVAGPVPLDVDTRADHEALLAADALRIAP
ncbi:MAG TPA: nucleotidyltransferase family protein [Iamia sp.]|jgi:molybdenum cofactor cytidylyltransferase|nr:nucleotidyltransferase family protein [Iamia sp.]